MGNSTEDGRRTEYLTPGEVARMLGVSTKTVDRWADGGKIDCIVTLGGHRRFRSEDVAMALDRAARVRPGRDAVQPG